MKGTYKRAHRKLCDISTPTEVFVKLFTHSKDGDMWQFRVRVPGEGIRRRKWWREKRKEVYLIILLYSLYFTKSSLIWVFSWNFSVPCASLSWLAVPVELPCIDNDADATKKFLLKTQVSEDFA